MTTTRWNQGVEAIKNLSRLSWALLLCAGAGATFPAHAATTTATPSDGSVLPFPPVPSASKAAPRLQDSVHKRRAQPQHLKPGAPNVLIILLDDVGFGQASTFGGEMNTPTLSRLASQGVSYNTFHTTAICSPTRAALLTGRNHQRVGNGTIAERAVDWDGYTGVIPKTSATMPKSCATMATRPRRSASGTTRRPTRPRRWDPSIAGRRVTASTISTVSSPAKLRNGNRGWSRTRPWSSRRTTRSIT